MNSKPNRETHRAADPYDLERFVSAQQHDYARVLAELMTGRKRSHWMWYIFPQFRGLGFSAMSQRYAIGSVDEARAYLRHPVLGPRLTECANALLALPNRSATEILGSPDDLKLRSSATLFAHVAPPGSEFERLLQKYWQGEPDRATLEQLRAPA
jgi:uncharacterized protein (DUF1810 family)